MLSDPAIGVDQLWTKRFKLHANMVPNFLSMELAGKILVIGKTINFLTLVCNENSTIVNNRLNTDYSKTADFIGFCFLCAQKMLDTINCINNRTVLRFFYFNYVSQY